MFLRIEALLELCLNKDIRMHISSILVTKIYMNFILANVLYKS